MSSPSIRRTAVVLTAFAAIGLAGAGAANAQEPTPDDNLQEYQCSPGVLGTGLLCNSAPAPGPAPEDDPFQGGPLGSDSDLANAVRGVLGGGLLFGG